jgi:hypothetical protein
MQTLVEPKKTPLLPLAITGTHNTHAKTLLHEQINPRCPKYATMSCTVLEVEPETWCRGKTYTT